MSSIQIRPFGGLTPKISTQLLPEAGAQEASNVVLTSGEIHASRASTEIATPVNAAPLAIFRSEYAGAEKWLDWAKDVDVVQVPLPVSVEPRYVWTGDGEPRYSKYTSLPSTYYALGVSSPQTAPKVSHSGGVGAAESRYYCYTFVQLNGTVAWEGGISPLATYVTGKVDGTWAITGMDVVPVNSGTASGTYGAPTTTFLNYSGSSVSVSAATNATPIVVTTAAHGYADSDLVHISGVTGNTAANGHWSVKVLSSTTFELYTPGTQAAVAGNGAYVSGGTSIKRPYHWLRVGDEIIINSVKLTVASVPAAYSFTVTGDYSAYTAWSRKAPWDTSGMTKNLYRTSGTKAQFQLVAEGITGTAYSDTLLVTAIPGDELISQDWIPPPVGMKGVIALPDGSLAGFAGNLLCRSEPYQPHAWPASYQRAADYDIVAIQSYGTTIVAATQAAPYVAEGVEPESVTLQKIDKVWPCLSKRSMVSIGDGVLYATNDGMAYIGQSGASIWTTALYTIEEWTPLVPSSMICAAVQQKVFLTYTSAGGAATTLVFHPSEPVALTKFSISAAELYADARNGNLYFVQSGKIKRWNADSGEFVSYTWRSKDFQLPAPVCFGAARVIFKSTVSAEDIAAATANYNADVAANAALIAAGTITHDYGLGDFGDFDIAGDNLIDPRTTNLVILDFTLFVDGVEKFTQRITSSQPFRLPAGYLSDNFSVQIAGTTNIQGIKLAETMKELATI